MQTSLPSASRMRVPRCHPDAGRRGIALVIVLAFIVLLTGLIVAFFARAVTARQVANAGMGGDRSDGLARSALDIVVGDLKQELVAGADPNSPAGVYRPNPKYPPTVLPARLGVPATPTSGTPVLPNLLQRSDAAATPPPTGPDGYPGTFPANRASAVNSSTDLSLNGRSIPTKRWNSHYLLPLATSAADQDKVPLRLDATPRSEFTAPDWVMVTRQGPRALTAYSPDLANRTKLNDYVVGRYAYAVYNQGGLLNLNVAGRDDDVRFTNTSKVVTTGDHYPPTTPNPGNVPNGGWARKGSLAFADLEELGKNAGTPFFGPSGNGISVMSTMVSWRNYGTLNSGTKAGNFMDLFTSGRFDLLGVNTKMAPVGDPNNTTKPPDTDHAFFSRQQMIDQMLSYYLGKGTGRTATTLSSVQSNLQYFGTSSREKNAPTYRPATPTAANPDLLDATVRFKTGGTLPNYALSGQLHSPTTTGLPSAVTVKVGDPVVRKRFSLRRLEWLTPQGPKSGVEADAIARHFGLKWAPAGATNDPAVENPPRWVYFDKTRNDLTPARTIKTLAEVASENPPREPDFFELLKAGIIEGSLGRHGNAGPNVSPPTGGSNFNRFSMANTQGSDWNKDHQLIRIGANIIDQADNDSYPTTIGIASPSSVREDMFYGIENLPYINKVLELSSWEYAARKRNGKPSVTPPLPADYCKIYYSFEMWNPHRVPLKASAPAAGQATPTDFRVLFVPSSRAQYRLFFARRGGDAGKTHTPSGRTEFLTDRPGGLAQIQFKANFDPSGRNFSEPAVLVDPTKAPNVITGAESILFDTFAGGVPEGATPSAALWAETIRDPGENESGEGPGKLWAICELQNTLIVAQYRNPQGSWQTYNVFAGSITNDLTGITSGNYTSCQLHAFGRTWGKNNNPPTGYMVADAYLKTDPRTGRFGASLGFSNGAFEPRAPSNSGGRNDYANLSWCPEKDNSNSSKPYREMRVVQQVPHFANPDTNQSNNYRLLGQVVRNIAGGISYQDNDGVLRPADAYLSGALGNAPVYANPFTQVNQQPSSIGTGARPVILDRPFRSVGELGYAFRDLPWKTLDFFSNREGNANSGSSADVGLLDLFGINDHEITADRVDLNTRNVDVLKALLSRATLEETVTGTTASSPTTLVGTNTANQPMTADKIAKDLVAFTASADAAKGPLFNRADLITRFKTTYDENIKSRRDGVARALGEVGSTRTWNLLIDVVAQSGRYTPASKALKDFVVEGERRYWLHVAIDRYTGEVIDRQLETVSE